MKTIEGFQQAKAVLSRRSIGEYGEVPSRVKLKLKEVFGTELSPEQAVARILHDVRERGDAAILDYTLKIDGITLTSLEITGEQKKDAYKHIDTELLSALKLASERIRAFHQAQKDNLRGVTGKEWGQLIRPLERVGVYAPGGTASYPSTVLMTAIPARVAGVKEIILTTPPKPDGTVPPASLVAADIAGVDRIFSAGGAQAIAGLAYGTRSIPKVDKICGPGNIFVMLAKKMVFGTVDIDGLQGPSEVLIIADDSVAPELCAADLLAQAEHDSMAQAIMVTVSRDLALKVQQEIARQLAALPRSAIAEESLRKHGIIAIVANVGEAIEIANLYAPEHLQLMVREAKTYLDKIKNAGCVFLGKDAPVAIGDYVAGPNHALPTGGTARFSSPLNVLDFVKFIDVVDINRQGLKKLAPSAITLARAEGFEAHARAVEKRLGRRRTGRAR
ncbi:MAG: histidinol dehydrogenase [Dehalococcoidia bacterium]|nr:histidinol dehydrogenase [Dehalococcoidia bacterium]